MCFIRPLRVKKIKGKKVILEKGIEAVYDERIGSLKVNDLVTVYGNLIIQKIGPKEVKYE